MKHILLILLFTLPMLCHSQADSAHTTVNNVVVKAKDLAFYLLYLDNSNKNEVLDSTIRIKYRTLDPSDNADVTISGIERRIWRDMLNFLYFNIQAMQSNRYKRVHDAIQLISDAWLNDKIIKDEATAKDIDDNLINAGKKIAKKQND